jgi:hypothetical protein
MSWEQDVAAKHGRPLAEIEGHVLGLSPTIWRVPGAWPPQRRTLETIRSPAAVVPLGGQV